jgi:salicylate hydroxylase
MELSLGINSVIKRTFYPGNGQLFSGVDDYMMSVPAEDIKRNPKLAHLLDIANSWWEPTGCVIAGIDGVGENVRYSMEFCNMSGESEYEGD